MRKIITMLVLAFVFTIPVMAQDNYKAEVFGGYQYTRFSETNFNGWNASATANVNSWLGFTGDLSGAYKSEGGASLKTHFFLFGPTVSYNQTEKIKPFAHALFGVARTSADFNVVIPGGGSFSGSGSDSAFAMGLGGGVDAGLSRGFAVRLIQFDYLMVRSEGNTGNGARISTGVVFRF